MMSTGVAHGSPHLPSESASRSSSPSWRPRFALGGFLFVVGDLVSVAR
jgi:hypothetical protein